jgi:hypothetical protein
VERKPGKKKGISGRFVPVRWPGDLEVTAAALRSEPRRGRDRAEAIGLEFK